MSIITFNKQTRLKGIILQDQKQTSNVYLHCIRDFFEVRKQKERKMVQ